MTLRSYVECDACGVQAGSDWAVEHYGLVLWGEGHRCRECVEAETKQWAAKAVDAALSRPKKP